MNHISENKNAPNMQSRVLVPDEIPAWKIEAQREVFDKCFTQTEYLWDEPNPTPNSDMTLRALHRGVVEMLASLEADYMFVLRFEQPLSFNAIRRRLKKFGALLDRYVLGRHWYKSPIRSEWIAVVEDRKHVHILIRLPGHRKLTRYQEEYGPLPHLSMMWTSMVRHRKIAARAHVSRLRETDDLRIAFYCAKRARYKEMWKADYEFLILSSEFHSRRVRHAA